MCNQPPNPAIAEWARDLLVARHAARERLGLPQPEPAPVKELAK